VTGTDALLWCGVAADLHVAGDDPAVVRAVDLPETKRAGRGSALPVPPARPVVPESSPEADS
jgi:hypothetical protein